MISNKSIGNVLVDDERAVTLEDAEIREPPFTHKNQFENIHGAKFKTIDNKSKMEILEMISPVFKIPEINNDVGLSLSPTRIHHQELKQSMSPQQMKPS